jgi:hypothetical protein
MIGELVESAAVARMPVERVPPGEAKAIRAMIETLKKQLEKRYTPGNTRRDAHPKHHGLVMARFTVDRTCPAELRHGVFSAPQDFEAWVRFSNGDPIVKHDLGPDLRGMAIKLPHVAGTLLGTPGQDFVMATGDGFFGKNAPDFVGFPEASDSAWKTIRYFFPRRLRGGWQLFKGMETPASPLACEYFSQTPYRLGPHCVKYCARPTAARDSSRDPWYLKPVGRKIASWAVKIVGWLPGHLENRIGGYNALRESLARDLSDPAKPVTMEFLVQRWPDLSDLPEWAIEDPTRSWTARWLRVATITFVSPADPHLGDGKAERSSFSPWHALPVHQPLGGINRARLEVYREMSRFRNARNQPQATGAPAV